MTVAFCLFLLQTLSRSQAGPARFDRLVIQMAATGAFKSPHNLSSHRCFGGSFGCFSSTWMFRPILGFWEGFKFRIYGSDLHPFALYNSECWVVCWWSLVALEHIDLLHVMLMWGRGRTREGRIIPSYCSSHFTHPRFLYAVAIINIVFRYFTIKIAKGYKNYRNFKSKDSIGGKEFRIVQRVQTFNRSRD